MRRGRELRTWDDWIGTLAGVGLCPGAPGTAGSLVWALAYLLLPSYSVLVWGFAALLTTVVGVVAANAMERRHGEDPSRFVLDELAGMQITLLGVEARWDTVLVGLVLFRLLDIGKPPPVRHAERLPGGLGVMADDLVAGLIARLGLLIAFGH